MRVLLATKTWLPSGSLCTGVWGKEEGAFSEAPTTAPEKGHEEVRADNAEGDDGTMLQVCVLHCLVLVCMWLPYTVNKGVASARGEKQKDLALLAQLFSLHQKMRPRPAVQSGWLKILQPECRQMSPEIAGSFLVWRFQDHHTSFKHWRKKKRERMLQLLHLIFPTLRRLTSHSQWFRV